ncbi:hypothetical protein NKJ90_32430 [Mesorhizobium sp. M0051]
MDHDRYRRMHGRLGGSMKAASFEVALKGKTQIADDSWAFVFERPDGFRFKAGQHVRMTLLDPVETDREGNSRFFSLASTPQETDLVIAMRMRDTAFKRVLARLQMGDKVLIQVLLDVPHGGFALHAAGSFSRRRHWHCPGLLDDQGRNRAKAVAPVVSVLFEPAAGGRCVSQGIARTSRAEPVFHTGCDDDRSFGWLDRRNRTHKPFPGFKACR